MTDSVHERWSAHVLDEQISSDRSVLERLRATPGVVVRDLHATQLAELAGLRGVAESELAESGRWVWYPWRSTLVNMLGPLGFRRLRLDRNRYKVTAAEQDAYARLTIGVVGASVGHWVLLGLALERLFGVARIADFDTVELSNLNRLPGSVLDYGVNKTVVAARRVAEIDPYVEVEPHPHGVGREDAAEFVSGLDVLIEVCDSLDVKLAVREAARAQGIPVIMVTSDRGTVDVERFDVERDRPPFHGLVGGVTAADLANMPAAAKVPEVMRIVGTDGLSARMAASMLEIGDTLTAWPHLAGDAMAAAASAVMAVRRLGAERVGGRPLRSGRVHLDIANRLDDLAEPGMTTNLPVFEPVGDYRNLPVPQSDVEALVRAAQLAPSGGNCQPWRIAADSDGGVRIELDGKHTTAMDVDFRASHVAVGAARLNMRIEAAARGMGPADSEFAALRASMLRRVTNRQIGDPSRAIPAADLAALESAARAHGAELAVVTQRAELDELAGLLAEADRIRFLLPELHEEMIAELCDPLVDSIDRGVDLRTLEMGLGAALLAIARRRDVAAEMAQLDLGHGLGAHSRVLAESASGFGLVTVAGGTAADYLRGGEAMQRVWITAGAAGMAIQPMIPLYFFTRNDAELARVAGSYRGQMGAARQRLRELFGLAADRDCVMLLRLSYAVPPTAISLRSEETGIFSDGLSTIRDKP